MNTRIINQGDPRWANLGYRTSPYTVVKEGCGLCAITMCAMELSKYWDYTPLDTIEFMRSYATNGNGTEWAGIDKGLDKYVGNHMRHYNMKSFWDEVSKGNRIGVILFGNAIAPDGKQWTKGGHYVMFNGYKYENGQHWLHTKDSSYREMSGWYSYERSMKGCIPNVLWTAKVVNMKNGWYKENNYWYFYKDGKAVKNEWAKDSKGLWYYLGSDGRMVTSKLIKWKNNDYYLKSDGAMASSEWIKFSDGWCYFAKDGKRLKGRWLRYKNNLYYLKGNGYMATGSMNVPCKFDENGKLVVK